MNPLEILQGKLRQGPEPFLESFSEAAAKSTAEQWPAWLAAAGACACRYLMAPRNEGGKNASALEAAMERMSTTAASGVDSTILRELKGQRNGLEANRKSREAKDAETVRMSDELKDRRAEIMRLDEEILASRARLEEARKTMKLLGA